MRGLRILFLCLLVAGVVAEAQARLQTCTGNTECSKGYYCSKALGDCDEEGTCTEIPDVCPLYWDPVCGCDGTTYSNSCAAAAAGVSVAKEEKCAVVSDCSSNKDCASGKYCMKAEGDCSGKGTCTDTPVKCPTVYDPVCGCDGETYSNSCYAAREGVSISTKGSCPAASCTENSQCGTGEYCSKGTGNCDGSGTCEDIPGGCPEIYAPVCGCDGKTYSNSCEAGYAGVNIAYEGACNIVCSSNDDCGENSYCSKAVGDCNGTGTCSERPSFCPDLYDPVCGCDGNTYANSCDAAYAGVNVSASGACDDACTNNGDCASGSFCSKATGDCSGTGTCKDMPTAGCPQDYTPVCGCDGITYSNSCEADAAGVSIDYTGTCTASYTYYLPYLPQSSLYTTGLAFSNYGVAWPTELTVKYYNNAGTLLDLETKILNANDQTAFIPNQVFKGPGWIKLHANNPVYGMALLMSDSEGAIVDETVQSSLSTDLIVPHVDTTMNWLSLFCVCNPNSVPITVSLEYYPRGGGSTQSATMSVPAGGAAQLDLSNPFGSNSGGTVHASSLSSFAAFMLYDGMSSLYSGATGINPVPKR